MKLSHLARAAACALSSIAAVNAASAQQLWTVDDDAPADFAVIQDAVNAAVNGDVILVRPGSYSGFQIVGKGLAVIGDSSSPPILHASVSVGSTLASQVIVLASLNQIVSTTGSASGLVVSSCVGSVRIEDCVFRGEKGGPAGTGARIAQSGDVILSACTARGGVGTATGNPAYTFAFGGGHGGDFVGAQVALYQSNFDAGGPGTCQGIHNIGASQGGNGVQLDGSFAFSSNARMQGGQGGCHSLSPSFCASSFGYGACGDGGHGLALIGGASTVNVQSANLIAGAAGISDCNLYAAYDDGHWGKSFYRQSPGSLAKRVNGQQRTLSAPAFVAGTTTVNVAVTGAVGDLVYVVVESAPHFQYDAALHGVWSLSYPPAPSVTPDAVVGASGSVSFQLTLPALSAGQEAQTWFVQPYVVDTSAQTFAGTPRSVTLAQ